MIRWYNCIYDVRSSLFNEMAWPPFGAKPMPEPMRNYCQWDPGKIDNWFQTEKDNERQARGHFLTNWYFICSIFKGHFTFWDNFSQNPWNLFTEFISVFRTRDVANILIDYPIVTDLLTLGFSSQYLLVAVCLIYMRSNLRLILVLWMEQSS